MRYLVFLLDNVKYEFSPQSCCAKTSLADLAGALHQFVYGRRRQPDHQCRVSYFVA